MNFPKFWARGIAPGTNAPGQPPVFSCWRWSDESQEAAHAAAVEAAKNLAEKSAQGQKLPSGYGYADRPFREEVIREMTNRNGERSAVLTRNAYGCLVLNTARAMFVDVDIPGLEYGPENPGFFSRLFGQKSHEALVEPFLRKAQVWAYSQSGWGWRIYRTRAGLRLLATHTVFEPDSPATMETFDEMGTDPLYRKLCEVQNCFRARLTPKPWRCGLHKPPVRWPFESAEIESRFQQWEGSYLSAAGQYATCRLVRRIGKDFVHHEIQPIVELHDQLTGAESDLPLA